jgi:hypothetical protein
MVRFQGPIPSQYMPCCSGDSRVGFDGDIGEEKYGSLFCVPTCKLVLLPGAKGRAAF